MMNIRFRKWTVALAAGVIGGLLLAMGCKVDVGDTATTGDLVVVVDETLSPLATEQVQVFEHQYSYAKVNLQFKPETATLQSLLNDEARIAITTRLLNEQEQAHFDRVKLRPRVTPIATDALALLIHEDNPDTAFTYNQLLAVLRGQTTRWDELDGSSSFGDINLVFDHQGSSTVSYVRSLISGAALPANAYAVKNNAEVVSYVAGHKNALGLTSLSWVSDTDDDSTRQLIKNIRVVAISRPNDATGAQGFFQPSQSNIADSSYALVRPVYMISREARAGLATGFAAFVAGDIGQRIILKSGLLPHRMPERLLQIEHKPIGQ